MKQAEAPAKLTPREWTALLDDIGRLMDDLTLGFGPEHVTVSRAGNLIKRLVEALERTHDRIDELDPDIRRSREHERR